MRDLKGLLRGKFGRRSSVSLSETDAAGDAVAVQSELKQGQVRAISVNTTKSRPSTTASRRAKKKENIGQAIADSNNSLLNDSRSDFSLRSEPRSGTDRGDGGDIPAHDAGAAGYATTSASGARQSQSSDSQRKQQQTLFPPRTSSVTSSARNSSSNNNKDAHSATLAGGKLNTSIPTEDTSTTSRADFANPRADHLQRHNTDTSLATDNDNDSDLDPGDGNWKPPVLTPSGSIQQQRPAELIRKQSLLAPQNKTLIEELLQAGIPPSELGHAALPSTSPTAPISPGIDGAMSTRKIWVKRPNSSATLVQIQENDLVDDVRDMILSKYKNSLGRSFDAPDVILRIIPRDSRVERTLGPEEQMWRTIDAAFPGGQTVQEALIIDVPVRRTPRQSPRPVYYPDEVRPSEAGGDYFPPMPVVPSPQHTQHVIHPNGVVTATPAVLPNGAHPTHSMSVITTGYVPQLPSPGGRRYTSRPRVTRMPTASPSGASQGGHQTPTSVINEHVPGSTPPVPLPPTPPVHEDASGIPQVPLPVPNTPRVSSPVPVRQKKAKKLFSRPSMPAGMLNGAAVPPINVLIVEDNIINLKLLEAFMKRLKVRWQTAMNGKEAMTKWRAGGFHLVLMDIQLPVMNGLEATREIRRLEKLNGIGVFSSSASSTAPVLSEGEVKEEDVLPKDSLFKSPVIIVALTASSLQSDRHEALAAGCNDFLTKPVNFVWLERKVMEWGCMQALIDFDGWRKWKDFSATNDASGTPNSENGDGKAGAFKKSLRRGKGSGLGNGKAGSVSKREQRLSAGREQLGIAKLKEETILEGAEGEEMSV